MLQANKPIEKKIGAAPEAPKPVLPETEKVVLPEQKIETKKIPALAEKKEAPQAKEAEAGEPAFTTVAAPMVAPPPKSGTLVKIEKILEEDLEDFYFSMPPEKQKVFKEKGEETASAIENMVRAGRAIGRKILKLIRAWLKLIPGVNKFFLEQEAKIKTDKVVQMAEKEKEKRLQG